MYFLGSASKLRYGALHPDLKMIVDETLKEIGLSIACSYRGYADQEAAFRQGTTGLHYPKSKHNRKPAEAMDCIPNPFNGDWKNVEPFTVLGEKIMEVAARLLAEGKITHRLRWGHDWDMDGIRGEKKEWDYPHFELVQ
jgi:peptidoglycan L-alanyl-D-glutamate endopeptidase CwlK